MDLELSDEQQALAESVRDFLDAQCPMSLVRAVVEQPDGAKGAEELWDRMVELDWPALAVPEADGGIGLGTVELAVLAEELGKVLCPAPLLSSATQFVPVVRELGSQEQRTRFFAALTAGGKVGTLALAEASGGVDLDRTLTTATPRNDGQGVALNGAKHFVYDAVRADEIAVVARAPGDELVVCVVPSDAPGLSVSAMNSIDATRALGTVELREVHIGPERVLRGPRGALERAIEQATVALAAETVGTSQAIFDIVHDYVLEREQFGVKIGSFQAVKHKLANMFVALESARATTYFAAAALDEDDERRHVAVSMAKSSAGDCQKLMATEGIQCLGGIGYTWEHDMHLYVKRQKAQAATFGTASEHRALIASHLGM
ncbi:MAG: acyl-CoA dehydrogenase family protein [Acidimicrobiales bacterium]